MERDGVGRTVAAAGSWLSRTTNLHSRVQRSESLIKASEVAKIWGHAWVSGGGEKGDQIQVTRPLSTCIAGRGAESFLLHLERE